MKYFLGLICLLGLSLSSEAQSVKTVFITDVEIAWLDNEIVSFDESIKKMQEAVEAKDRYMIAANKTAIIKAINRLSTNCNTTVGKIDTEINPPEKSAVRDLDTPPDYYYNKKKNTEALQELKLTDSNIAALRVNAAKLKVLKDKLSDNEYFFHPKYPVAAQNMTMVKDMLSIAKTSNSIIQRSVVAY
ncbi:MAG: hypothetical protein EBS24_04905 [Chitinophagia bacterium]|nr:hypothetical protein [Chitinophagia bacterium]